MDEKLRRLGLSSDATVDPLKGKGKEFSEAYMEKIRTEQKDRRRLRREKEYRRYMASDQYLKEGDHGAEAKMVQAAVESARSVLLEEKNAAEAVVHARDRKEVEKYDRASRLQKVVAIEKNIFEEAKAAASEAAARADSEGQCNSVSGMGGVFSQLQPADSTFKVAAKHEQAVELCKDIVSGLVELTFLVSDKRFLLEEELTGKPVRCVEQDLKVSEWNEWVQLCLHKSSCAPQTSEVQGAEQRVSSVDDSVSLVVGESPEHRMASEQFSFAVQQEEKHEAKIQKEVLRQVVSILHNEGKRLRKVSLDEVRRVYERSLEEAPLRDTATNTMVNSPINEGGSFISNSFANDPSSQSGLVSAGRVEVIPRWTHRVPSACTFVHGDELSGVRLLTEAIERQVRNAGAKGPVDGEAPPAAPTGKAHDKTAAAPTPEKQIGFVRVEDGVKKTYITPRTLLGRAHPSLSGNAAAGTRAAARHGGGGKGAPHHKLPAEDDERKDFEAMVEILSREIVSAHFHNLCLISGGKVPPISAVQPQVDHTPRRARAANKKEENAPPAEEKKDETLHCLYLVGFPEADVFYQMLEIRMGPAIEAAEVEIAVEQHRLDEQAAQLQAAALAATPGSRGRSHSTSATPKPKAPPPTAGGSGRGKGNKSQVVEDTALLVAQQALKKAFPPICIVGYFIEYDIPARQRRLREAYTHSIASPNAGGGLNSIKRWSGPAQHDDPVGHHQQCSTPPRAQS